MEIEKERKNDRQEERGKGERRGRGTEGLKEKIDHISLALSVKNLSDHHREGADSEILSRIEQHSGGKILPKIYNFLSLQCDL